jgi:hypothetical protein
MLRGQVTNSGGFGGSQSQDNGVITTQPNKMNGLQRTSTPKNIVTQSSTMAVKALRL